MATEALGNLPEGGKPVDLPSHPEAEAGGPPDLIPPVEAGGAPEFDELTGLPLIEQKHSFEEFPGQADDMGEADDVIGFLF